MKTLKIYALEGLDGSGKSSIATCLKQAGHTVLKFPSKGSRIEKILKLGCEIHPKVIPSMLKSDMEDSLRGKTGIVFCDRYVYSTWVYQKPYSPTEELFSPILPYPERVFYCRCSLDTLLTRVGQRQMDACENVPTEVWQQRLAAYEFLYRKNSNWVAINSEDFSPEDCAKRILEIIEEG